MTGSVEEEILELRDRYRSDRDPSGRGFVPLADALRRAGRLDEAMALVEEGLAALPDLSPAHLVAAWIHRDLGNTEGAQGSLRAVLRLDPLNVVALRHLARFREADGDGDEAEVLLARAVGVDGGAGVEVDREVLGTAAAPEPTGAGGVVVPIPGSVAGSVADDGEAGAALTDAGEAGWPEVEADGPEADTGWSEIGADGPEADAGRPEVVADEFDVEVAWPEAGADGADSVAGWPEVDAGSTEEEAAWPGGDASAAVESGPGTDVADADAPPGDAGDEEAAGDLPWAPLAEEPAAEDATLPDADPDWFVEPWEEPGDDGADEPPFPGEGVHTRTMGELYASQGLLDRAVEVFEGLVEADPGDAGLAARLDELRERRRARRLQGLAADPQPTALDAPAPSPEEESGAVPDVTTAESGEGPGAETLHLPTDAGSAGVESPFAWTQPSGGEDGGANEGGAGPTVSDFFDDILGWTPGESVEAVAEAEEADDEAPSAATEEAAEAEDEAPATATAAEAEDGAEDHAPTEAPWGEGVEDEAPQGVSTQAVAPDSLEEIPVQDGPAAAELVPSEPFSPIAERVEVESGLEVEVEAPAPTGGPDDPIPVSELAPDGPLPTWVPVASLAPDGPVPTWVPVASLAPDPPQEPAPAPDEAPTPSPDASDDDFRAWLERLRL